ncbi:hypothetical protein SUGI_0989290 [Cryptomeria japonica]|uniref:uncharacterized protein LOC131030002 n=1 Tax=Cryptomeria japonica TaxID=3369 RepID=UPI002414C298|nr:uncharacterized protein LOC131030002 [Cryptomeria japonica]GLJ46898.1 hypothetical protein SUGI_0989290 [Cryptomeria japonica]
MTGSMNIVACLLALLFASSAVSSKSVLLDDHGHQDFRPAHTVVDSQSYHVEDSNGLGFTHRLVTPKRLKGTARKLAIISETRNEEKQMTETKSNSLDNAVQSGGLPAKSTVYKQRDSKKIKHLPPSSSGIQTSLSLHQENKFVSRDQVAIRFTFQKKTTRALLASSARSLEERPKQDASSTKEAAKRDEASFQGAKPASTPHESQNFSTSRSATYQSNETDLYDLVDMDYGKVHRKPPIHNSSSP